MSISGNSNGERNRKAFFSSSNSCSSPAATLSIIIALMLLASGFVLFSPTTPMNTTTTAFAQEENNAITTATINGDADSDTDGSVQGAGEEGGGAGNGNINSSTTTTTAAASFASSGMMELSSQPVWQEQATTSGMTPINQTHSMVTFIGNGTLTVPDTGQTMNMTNNGTAFISPVTGSNGTVSAYGKENIFSSDDGNSTAITFHEIVHYDPATLQGRGIVVAVFDASATGMLAPFNGMFVVGTHYEDPNAKAATITLWEWKSGIGSNSSGVAPPAVQ